MTAAGYPMHQTTIAKLEGGKRPTTIGEVSGIATIFSISMAALFDTYDQQGYEEMAILANQLAALAAERVKVTERLTAIDAESASVQTQYDDLQQEIEEEEERARQEAESERNWEAYVNSDDYAEDMAEQARQEEEAEIEMNSDERQSE